jgi:Protein of unknown function (DUF1553)/Protein of unknown function (DUF1549)/Planctomycete cytochrome C
MTHLVTADETLTATAEKVEFFESKVRPLLHSRCVECHNDEEPESGLSLESRAGLLRGGKLGASVVPGKPKESLLISAVNHDEFLKMPPKDKLSTTDLAVLSKWVAMGAPWPESQTVASASTAKMAANNDNQTEVEFTDEQKNFWSYQPLKRIEIPITTGSENVGSPIDYFIGAKLSANGLRPSPPATRRELIRRATYDLIGLPPNEEQIESFVNDHSPDAYAKVVDRLLSSVRYGERWGRHWLDVARFADSNGLDENIAYANAFRYRDYVINAFNQDKAYDRFVQEQVAGDLLGPDPESPEPLDRFVATGFLAIGAKMLAEDDPVKMQMDIIDEQLSTVCQAFMGMTIGCARCHDHKFDPFPASDYYALAGIFKSTQTMENHKVVARWFERPIATETELEAMKKADAAIAVVQTQVDELNQQCLERVRREIQTTVAQALLATTQYREFDQLAKLQLTRGLDEPSTGYQVKAGYVLVEAEGFQRGNVVRDSENYGKEIGVIASTGAAHVEYDIEVEHAGTYALELHYAAEDRRPVKLFVDGTELKPPIARDTTGGWNPNDQAWFVSALIKLAPGPHVLRLESRRLFPHIDKFALVYHAPGGWPFGDPPLALSRMGIAHGVSYPVVQLWQNYFAAVRKAGDMPDSLFDVWFRASASEPFSSTWSVISKELAQESSLRKSTPEILRDSLRDQPPTSLQELSETYQRVITSLLAAGDDISPANKALKEKLLVKESPLNGPESNVDHFYSLPELAKAEELESQIVELQKLRPAPPMAMGVTEATPEDLKIHLRGSHLVQGKLVSRRVPQILSNIEHASISHSQSGRLELAHWMTRSNHPLTSRVMANRVWHWHFGRGIVPSVDNFGVLGMKPTHPELLDWLAWELVQSGWSLKHLHRTIMLSQTYQMGGEMQPQAAETDPGNELMWRFRRRRLTAEETRDSILSVGVGLDQTMYGSLMKSENHKYVNNAEGSNEIDYVAARRTVYLPVIRSGVFDVLQTLDFPDPAMINGERQTSTVAPQALLMMNSDLVQQQTLAIAQELSRSSLDDSRKINAIYRRILKREPKWSEVESTMSFLQRTRHLPKAPSNSGEQQAPLFDIAVWQSLCRVLISSNEFSYLE